MLDGTPATTVRKLPPVDPTLIQFFAIEIMPTADGLLFVGVKATLCEPVRDDDFELVDVDMASERVTTIDEALAVIRAVTVPVH